MCKEALARRWDALYLRDISDERLSIGSFAEQLRVDWRILFRGISLAMEDLSMLLFGIEAIEDRKNRG